MTGRGSGGHPSRRGPEGKGERSLTRVWSCPLPLQLADKTGSLGSDRIKWESTAPPEQAVQSSESFWQRAEQGEKNRSSLQWQLLGQVFYFLEHKASFFLSPLQFRTSYQWQGPISKALFSHTLKATGCQLKGLGTKNNTTCLWSWAQR